MNGDIEELKQKVAKLEESPTKLPFKIPEASLLILIVTASCYLLIFWYESGWCFYFHINPAFIHPDLFTMLGSGIGGILVLALLLMAIALFFHYKLTKWGRIMWIALILGTIAIFTIEQQIRKCEDFTIGISVVIWWGLVTLPPLYYRCKYIRKSKSKYKDYLKEHTSKYKVVVTIPLLIGLLYIFCGAAYWYGRQKASTAEDFFCRNGPRELIYPNSHRREVVLRVYGSTAITATIDNTNNVYPDFCFIKMEGETNVFTLTKIGRLTPQLPSKPQPQPAQDISQTKPNPPTIPTNQIRANQTGTITNASRTP